MQELNAHSFLGAVTHLRGIITALNNLRDGLTGVLTPNERRVLSVAALVDALQHVRARSAFRSAVRLGGRLDDETTPLTYDEVRAALQDIESRFVDHLHDIRLFVMSEEETAMKRDGMEQRPPQWQ